MNTADRLLGGMMAVRFQPIYTTLMYDNGSTHTVLSGATRIVPPADPSRPPYEFGLMIDAPFPVGTVSRIIFDRGGA